MRKTMAIFKRACRRRSRWREMMNRIYLILRSMIRCSKTSISHWRSYCYRPRSSSSFLLWTFSSSTWSRRRQKMARAIHGLRTWYFWSCPASQSTLSCWSKSAGAFYHRFCFPMHHRWWGDNITDRWTKRCAWKCEQCLAKWRRSCETRCILLSTRSLRTSRRE